MSWLKRHWTGITLSFGLMIVVLSMILHGLSLSRLKQGDFFSSDLCPQPPPGQPLEYGGQLTGSVFPPSITCTVGSQDSGWEESQTTYDVLATWPFFIGIAVCVLSVIFLVIRRRRQRKRDWG